MAGLKRDLPVSTNNVNDVRRARKQIKCAVEAASRAYTALFELFPGYSLPVDVREAARAQWLDEYVNEKVKSVDNLAGSDVENVLPVGQLANIRHQWEKKREQGKQYVHTIAELVKKYPRGKYVTLNGQISCENLNELATSMTAAPVGDVCKELFRLYANVVDDLGRLNHFAHEHDCKHFPAILIGKWATATDFADAYSCGVFSVHPTDEQLGRLIQVDDDTPRLTDKHGQPIQERSKK